MSSIVALSGVDEIKAKLCDLSKDLDKYAPEHRSQVMVDRLRQQKLRAMISLAKAQQFLAETDVLIADYNLQAVADEFEHMKKERFSINTDMRPSPNSASKEEKLVLSTDFPANSGNAKDICCIPLLNAVGNSKSKEKGTEFTPKLSTQHPEAHRSKSKTDANYKIGDSEPATKMNEPKSKVTETSSKTHELITSKTKESSYKTKETATSKTYELSSFKTKEAATSKSYEPSSSKTKEAATSKTYEPSSSKTKEGATSKSYEPSLSKTKEAATSKTYEPSSSKTKEAATLKSYEPSSSKTKEAATSKTYEPSSSKTKEAATSKSYEPSSSKTKEAATSKSYEPSSSKTKEAAMSKTYEATTSAKEATSLAESDLPAPGLKRKKRNRSKSKSKESKRHKSSHAHAASSNAAAESTHAPPASLYVPIASPVVTSLAPDASSNVNTVLGSAASSLAHTAFSRALVASSVMPVASSHVHALLSHAPNCSCPKYNRTDKEKTLLNTSISPIQRIVEDKRVQTDEKKLKNDIVQTDEVKTVTKGVQTDNVIILHVESQTVTEHSPINDEDTLLLDTLPPPHSHSTAISLAKALQQIKTQKTSVLERLCPTGPDVSEVLSQNEVFQKIELMMDDEAERVEESPGAVKMELVDEGLPNTSTELLVNNLYKDIMKAKEEESKDQQPKRKVTKRALWKILDKC